MYDMYFQQFTLCYYAIQKPSSLSRLEFLYVTNQFHHSLVVHPLLRKILDLPPQIPIFWDSYAYP